MTCWIEFLFKSREFAILFFFVCFCLFSFLILLIKVRKITPDPKNLRFCNTHWLEEEHYNLIKKDAFQKLYQFAKRNNQFKGENISCNNLWQNINLPESKRFVSIWNKYFLFPSLLRAHKNDRKGKLQRERFLLSNLKQDRFDFENATPKICWTETPEQNTMQELQAQLTMKNKIIQG